MIDLLMRQSPVVLQNVVILRVHGHCNLFRNGLMSIEKSHITHISLQITLCRPPFDEKNEIYDCFVCMVDTIYIYIYIYIYVLGLTSISVKDSSGISVNLAP